MSFATRWKFLAAGCLSIVLVTGVAADGVQDVKRKAASQLLHDGRYNEALTLMNEVTAADDSNFADHLWSTLASSLS